MPDPSLSRELDWRWLFPLRLFFRAARLAMGLRSLAASTMGLWLTVAGWYLAGRLFGLADNEPNNLARANAWPWQTAGDATFYAWPWTIESWRQMLPAVDQTVLGAWERLSAAFSLALDPSVTPRLFLYLATCGLWALAVWSLLGGIVTRLSALGLTRDEYLHWNPAVKFVTARWASIAGGPLVACLGIGLLAAPVVAIGALLRFHAGMLLAGLLWPLALVAGAAMALLALGLLFGWPLMWAAVGVEGADAFEAISRAYAYVFHRPVHYLLYATQSILVGALGWLLVSLFARALLSMSIWAASWGSGADPIALSAAPDAGVLATAGGGLIRFWTAATMSVVGAYSYSYLWNASTAIYLALRRELEATELDEVFVPEEAESPFGLPPLEQDEAGVPRAPDDSAEPPSSGAA